MDEPASGPASGGQDTDCDNLCRPLSARGRSLLFVVYVRFATRRLDGAARRSITRGAISTCWLVKQAKCRTTATNWLASARDRARDRCDGNVRVLLDGRADRVVSGTGRGSLTVGTRPSSRCSSVSCAAGAEPPGRGRLDHHRTSAPLRRPDRRGEPSAPTARTATPAAV